ncbi:MAG: alpha/beta hydrolase [Oleiphilaceae bacterium]|nr:alpha/beta hydrolase [Oleiphilaceae bacterium]
MNDFQVRAEPTTSDKAYQEMRWPLRHLTLAGLHWPARNTTTEQPPVIMLHGWLDNCLSFTELAPDISAETDVYAIDMSGHGYSGHRPPGQGYLLADYVAELAELLDTAFNQPVDLVGHSLGGIVALMYAAIFPEKVRKLVTIDSLGPMTKAPDDAPAQLRRGIAKRLSGSVGHTVYPSIEEAARARAGGMIPLSAGVARQLVGRNLKSVERGFQWRTDPKLRHPSLMTYTESQAIAFLQSVKTETLLVRAEDGLLSKSEKWPRRLAAMTACTHVVVPGAHHCHLDGNTRPTANSVRGFLTNDG